MIISINGTAGAGKTTIAKRLAANLGWPHYYMGGIRREKARERGLTLAEYNRLGETDPTTDREVDDYLTELGRTEDDFIIDSRTAWHFIPLSLKIYLTVDERIGAERIFRDLKDSDDRNEGRDLKTVETVIQSNRARRASDTARYKKYYGFDCYDPAHYDLVIDTSKLTSAEVFANIKEFITKHTGPNKS